MSQQARQSRRDAARRRERAAARPGWLLPAAAAVIVVAVGAVAVVLGGGGDTSPLPSAQASASLGSGAAPTVTGASLPRFEDPTDDPAVGQVAPTVVGSSFDGSQVTIGGTGRATMIVFLAHWCNHCQAEVPVVQAWLDRGSLPDGVDLVSVSTSTDPNAPNYPPDEWLAREGWTPPVAVDPTGSIAQAYGLSAFPYFVFVDADGTVVGRQVGELAPEVLDQVAAALAP